MLHDRAAQMMVETRTELSAQIKEGILRPSAADMKKPELTSNPSVGGSSGPQPCAGCGANITDRFLLKAVNKFWHEDCLKCGACDCRLGEVGSTLYEKANLILCRRDYLRLFGSTGYCAACSRLIPAFEMVMRARDHVYHLECFACQQCNHRFCVGDRFYLCDGKILCEYDYEERRVFATLPYTPASLDHIKRQVNNIQADAGGSYQQSVAPHSQQRRQSPQQRRRRGGATGGDRLCAPLHGALTQRLPADDASSGYGSPDSVTMDGR